MDINPEYFEKVIISNMMKDNHFCVVLLPEVEERYFNNAYASEIFLKFKQYYEEYFELPKKEIIINSCKNPNEINKYFQDIESIESVDNVSFLYNKTEEWLKEQALKYAIMDSVDLIEKKQDINKSRDYIEQALTKTLVKQIGLDYWGDLSERLKRMFSAQDKRIPSYFPQLDEIINGGFPPYTLSVIAAAMHYGKSNLMINLSVRQMMHGKNVIYLTLEMSEDEVAKRVDAQLAKLDINRIYDTKKKEFLTNIKNAKTEDCGRLIIKQFPTGTASSNDFRAFLYDLKMRNIDFDIAYVDYLNIMKPNTSGDGNLYTDVKKIGEELRAMTYIFHIPVVSSTQLTRSGITSNINELTFANLSESIGTAATADFIMVLGSNDDDLIYQNEIFYKILKNRLGGRVGEVSKFFQDNKSLKMYDSTELDVWLQDAMISGDKRELS